MKKILVVLLVAACAVSLTSCKEKKEAQIFTSPEKVTEEFVKAFYTADFDNMYKYILKSNHKLIQSTQENLSKDREKALHENKIEIQDVKCTFQNDSVAECTCKFLCNGEEQEIPWILKKSNEKWFVDLTL